MKLAEALQERADVKRLIDRLNKRLTVNAVTQEGELPAEDPAELLRQLDECLARLEMLMAKINLANSTTVVRGRTLTEMIARRDCARVHRCLSDDHRRGQPEHAAHGAHGDPHRAHGGRSGAAKARRRAQRGAAAAGQ